MAGRGLHALESETVLGRHGSPRGRGVAPPRASCRWIKDVPGLVAYHFADAGGGVMDLDERVLRRPVRAEESNKREGEWDAENLAELMLGTSPEITAR